MPSFVRTYNAIQWDGSNLTDVIAVIETRGPGTAFGEVTESGGVVTVPSGMTGDLVLQQPGWWFVANDQLGEALSDADFQARYRAVG